MNCWGLHKTVFVLTIYNQLIEVHSLHNQLMYIKKSDIEAPNGPPRFSIFSEEFLLKKPESVTS